MYRQKNSATKEEEGVTPADGAEEDVKVDGDSGAEAYYDEEEYNEEYDEAIVQGPTPTAEVK